MNSTQQYKIYNNSSIKKQLHTSLERVESLATIARKRQTYSNSSASSSADTEEP